jgi:hypothetical protein
MAIVDAINPAKLGGDGADLVSSFAAHQQVVELSAWIGILIFVTMVPSVFAATWACRRRRPVFSAVAGFLIILGLLSGLSSGNNSLNLVALVGIQKGVDHGTLVTLVDGISASPLTAVPLAPTFLAVFVGRILLGVLLWRAAIAPRWMAIALIVAPVVEFLNFTNSNAQPALSYVLTAIGFASATVALLKMRNDDFDLPPLERAPSTSAE